MRFIADGMLGGLGRVLRMLGIDCSHFSGPAVQLLLIAKRENRIILTRNTRLKGRKGVIFISSQRIIDQLKELNQNCDIKKLIRPLTRCLICNVEIVPIDKEAVKERIPYYTYLHFDEFYTCPSCHRIYWNGSHRKGMEERVQSYLDALT
ncbi:hypothetical protein DRP53_06885 [candidate division WOR-3 bacterium]|uniref:Mut7-C RNAse domain-containing protein n=1 Tax=candidate division WOR-3 bacterium TaxID=2052148 RepID=A0A660SIK3_UNCW3|nr:MAG: hypothetical protein DRP53_06885 [candidate division WOR-3 bacterium]